MPVQPLDDAAFERIGLGLESRHTAVELDDACALVEIRLPILGRPAVVIGPQQRHNLGFVPGESVQDSSRRRRGRIQHQGVAVDSKMHPGRAGRLERLDRPHNRALQP
jgi:hypothetical protein